MCALAGSFALTRYEMIVEFSKTKTYKLKC